MDGLGGQGKEMLPKLVKFVTEIIYGMYSFSIGQIYKSFDI